MKKIIIIVLVSLLLFVSFFIISCKETEEEPHKNDDIINTNDNEPNTNLGGDDNTGIKTPEIKVIENFTVDSEIDLYLDEEVKLNIEYDKDIDVEFSYTIDNDNITINENTIKGVKPGISIITVKEERSNISKDITINILLKKNKTIDFYNGYYVYKECVYSSTRYYYCDALYRGRKVMNITDETLLKEITPKDGYDKAYQVCDSNNALLIKGEELFGGLIYEWDKDHQIIYQVIYSLDYYYEEPLKKEQETNNQIGIANGVYTCDYSVYSLDGGGIVSANSRYYGLLAMMVDDDIYYQEIDAEALLGSNLDRFFLDIDRNEEVFSYPHELSREDIQKWYNAYLGEDLLYSIIMTENDIYYVDIKIRNEKYLISNIIKAVLLEEYDISYLDNTISLNEYLGDYAYGELIYSEFDNVESINNLLISKFAFSIKEDDAFLENEDLSLITDDLNLGIVKRYDFNSDSDRLIRSLLISDDQIYYAIFEKRNAVVRLSKIWKLGTYESNTIASDNKDYYVSEIVYTINMPSQGNSIYSEEFSKKIIIDSVKEVDKEYTINYFIYSMNCCSMPNSIYHYYTNNYFLLEEYDDNFKFIIEDNIGYKYLLVLSKSISGGYYITEIKKLTELK